MEHDHIEMYLAAERERRRTPREREIHDEINRIGERHQRELVAECEPLYKELTEIEARKAPMPIVMDGKIFEYVGPGGR